MRLAYLFLRSRLAGRALACLAAVAALTGLWLRWDDGEEVTALLLPLVMPLAAATIVGTSARSPFGDAEATASRSLPALRFGHLAGLLLLAAAALTLAAVGAADSGAELARALARNLAGFVGLALLAARLVGSGASWAPPLAYSVYVLQRGPEDTTRWTWPLHAGTEREAAAIAAALLIAGLAAVAHGGAREAP